MGRGFHRQRRLSSWREVSLHTWKRPSDPTVYGIVEVDVGAALEYLSRVREVHGEHVTITHLVGKAAALAIGARPEVNAVVRRRWRVYVRESVDIFFQVAFDRGEDLSGAKVSRADEKSLVEIARELSERAERVRAHRDRSLQRTQTLMHRAPAFLRGPALRVAEVLTSDLGLDLRRFGVPYDPFGSAMVTNVGTFGLPLGFAPLVPFARTPILVTIGTVKDAPVAVDGEVRVRPVLPLGVTFDHRLLDGYDAGQLAQTFLGVLEDPEATLGPA
jgi:pyruvate dehydrogenase E2 component (dihydrolipoamide acetyltransferase)